MSSELDEVARALFNGQIPNIWRKLAPATLKSLGNWMEHFLKRLSQYNKWVSWHFCFLKKWQYLDRNPCQLQLVFIEVLVELEFRNVGFCKGRKTGQPGEKPSEQGQEPTPNSTHMRHRAGIEPGPQWWEASLKKWAFLQCPLRIFMARWTEEFSFTANSMLFSFALRLGQWRWARSDLVIWATHSGVLLDSPGASHLS